MDDTAPGQPAGARWLAVLTMAAGVWLLAAPVALDYPGVDLARERATGVDIALGAAILLLSWFHLLRWNSGRWAAKALLAAGLALVVAPLLLGYWRDDQLTAALVNDLVVGAAVTVVAFFGLRWSLTT